MKRTAAFAVIALAALTGPAFAQAEACVDPNTRQVDAAATQTWQQMAERSDRDLMNQIAGTWYIEVPNAYNSQVDYQYQSYSNDGVFSYKDRVCDTATNGCNDYAGQGSYAVIGMADGTIQFMTIVSDLNRDRQCSGTAARLLDADTLQFSTGGVMRRVK